MAQRKRKKGGRRAKAPRPRPPASRRRRLLGWAALFALPAVTAGVLVLSFTVRNIAEDVLRETWGDEVEIGGVRGFWSETVTLRDVRLFRGPDVLVSFKRVRATFEAPLTSRDPGELLALTLSGAHLVVRGRDLARREAPPAPPAIPPPSRRSPGAALTRRIPERVRIEESRLDFVFPREASPPFVVPVTEIALDLVRDGPGQLRLQDVAGEVFGGRLTAFGDIGLGDETTWAFEANLLEVDLATLVRDTDLSESFTEGDLAGYVKLSGPTPARPYLAGAGWVSAKESRVWGLPIFSGILEALGVVAGGADAVEHARARFRVDEGRFHFSELVAVGRPVSLYGNGAMDLDGARLEADFIPRLGRGLAHDLPVVGAPTQLLLDVAKGVAIEVQVRGSLASPEVTTLPLPVITRPVQEFFRLVGGG